MSQFQALGLPEVLCRVLAENGITEPTAVQTGAIPIALSGRDLLSSARTGSGKTLAYCLPALVRIAAKKGTALVLVPTREIGVQVQDVLQPYLKAMNMGPATLIIGGVSPGPQHANLRRNPPVIVATPGRLNDHLRSGKLRLDHVHTLVLDEADRMLDMGFLPQVKQILPHLGRDRQTMLFSATMPGELQRICDAMMKEPARVAVDAPNVANVDVEQRMLEVTSDGKNNALLDALKDEKESVLVFARTKRRTDKVAQFLESYGVRAERIHGDRSQGQRQKAIDSFRSGKTKVLVATDIAGRGLDIPSVALVINFDLPEMREDYVHRIGRTGRAGEKGIALSFVAPEDRGHWAGISGSGKAPSGGRSRPQPAQRNSRPSNAGGRFVGAKRDDRGPAPARSENRPSRFKPWGQARTAEPRQERSSEPRQERSFSGGPRPRQDRGPAPRTEERAYDGRQRTERPMEQRKPSFGGHGRSAPPALAGARGRWSRKTNRDQPTS